MRWIARLQDAARQMVGHTTTPREIERVASPFSVSSAKKMGLFSEALLETLQVGQGTCFGDGSACPFLFWAGSDGAAGFLRCSGLD